MLWFDEKSFKITCLMLFKIDIFWNVFFALHPAQARDHLVLHFFSDFSLPLITTQLLLSFLITVSNHQGSLYSFVKLLCHSCHGHSNFISRPKIHEKSFILSPFPGTFHDIYQCNTVRVTNRNICTRFS